MPLASRPLEFSGGLDSDPAKNAVGRACPVFENAILGPGGLALRPAPGFKRSMAFSLWDKNPQREHRVVWFSSLDAFQFPGGVGIGIVDGISGRILAMGRFPGGVDYPVNSSGNAYPPHEFLANAATIEAGTVAWTESQGAATVITESTTTAPLLNAAYQKIVLTTSVAAGIIGYYGSSSQLGVIEGYKNAIQLWMYYEATNKVIPGGTFSFKIGDAATLGSGTVKTMRFDGPIYAGRWTPITLDWDNDEEIFRIQSYGLNLVSTMHSSLFDSGSMTLRLALVRSGVVTNLNRLGPWDRMNISAGGLRPDLYFGNEFNEMMTYDGSTVRRAGIRPFHRKPIPEYVAASSAVIEDGTGSWSSSQANFISFTSETGATTTSVFSDGASWVVPAGQAAYVAVADASTAPVSNGGGNYLGVTLTKSGSNQAAAGLLAYKNVAPTISASLNISYEYFLDFSINAVSPADAYSFSLDSLALCFYTGTAGSGTELLAIPLSPDPLDARSLDELRVWRTAVAAGVAGTVASIGLKLIAQPNLSCYNSSNEMYLRFDTLKTVTNTGEPDGNFKRMVVTRKGHGHHVALGNLGYKNASSSISATHKVHLWMRVYDGCHLHDPHIPADTLRLVFNGSTALGGTDVTGGGDYGLIRTALTPQWTKITVDVDPAGLTYQSFGFKLEKGLHNEAYWANCHNLLSYIDFDAITTVSTTSGTPDAAFKARFAVTLYDPDRFKPVGRESDPSPFSDEIGVPASGALRLDISGFKSGMPAGSQNFNPDPLHVTRCRVYYWKPEFSVDEYGRLVAYRLIDVPIPIAEADGKMIVELSNLADYDKAVNENNVLSFNNGVPPSMRALGRDGDRFLGGGRSAFSIGKVTLTQGSHVATAYDNGVDEETAVFGPWCQGLFLRPMSAGSSNRAYPIAFAYKDSGAWKLYLADFDAKAQDWINPFVGVSGDHEYIIDGPGDVLRWSGKSSAGPNIETWPQVNRTILPMPNDRIEHVAAYFDAAMVSGRNATYALDQTRASIDDAPQIGPAYVAGVEAPIPPAFAPRTTIRTPEGRMLYLAQQGSVVMGTIQSGFQTIALSDRIRAHMTDGNALRNHDIPHGHAVYDRRHKIVWMIFPGFED